MFCKLVFWKLQNMRWPSNVPEISNRGAWWKWLKPPNIYGAYWHSVTKRGLLLSKTPPPKNSTQHKWHLTTTLLVFWGTTNTLLIEPTLTTISYRRVPRISLWSEKISALKSHDHGCESYNKFKNLLLRHHVFWVLFVICYFCKVSLFSNDIKGCHFCWVYLMVVKLLPVVWRETSDKTCTVV